MLNDDQVISNLVSGIQSGITPLVRAGAPSESRLLGATPQLAHYVDLNITRANGPSLVSAIVAANWR
jgi:hypothetical protein